jgi:hypothetical protein
MSRVRWLVEAGLAATSIYLIWAFSDLGQRAAGAYVGIAANGLYAAAWLGEARSLWGRARQPDGVAAADVQ